MIVYLVTKPKLSYNHCASFESPDFHIFSDNAESFTAALKPYCGGNVTIPAVFIGGEYVGRYLSRLKYNELYNG